MSVRQTSRAPVPALLAAGVLVLFSATGLLAGNVAHAFTAALSPQPATSATTTTTGHPTARPATTAPANTAAAAITSAFTLVLSASPNPVVAGQPLQVTVNARSQDGATPIAGLTCALDTPRDGGTPLLNVWPSAAVTDAMGRASWTLKTGGIVPGAYEIDVTSVGASYSYHQVTDIAVTAPAG